MINGAGIYAHGRRPNQKKKPWESVLTMLGVEESRAVTEDREECGDVLS